MPPKLDPEKERQNAKTVIARMSGQEPHYDVYAKIPGQGGAVAFIFLGSVGIMPKDQLGPECQRQWPTHFKAGLRLRKRP